MRKAKTKAKTKRKSSAKRKPRPKNPNKPSYNTDQIMECPIPKEWESAILAADPCEDEADHLRGSKTIGEALGGFRIYRLVWLLGSLPGLIADNLGLQKIVSDEFGIYLWRNADRIVAYAQNWPVGIELTVNDNWRVESVRIAGDEWVRKGKANENQTR